MYTNSPLSSIFISAALIDILHVLRVLICAIEDVVDVDLLLADQVQQQIERAVILVQVEVQR